MKRSRSFFFKIRLWSGWSSNSVFWTVFPTLSNVKLKKFPTLVSGNSGGVFWTVFQLCPIWSSIFFQLWSRGNSGGAASGCWCNFSAPTIIICTKAVPSAQFSNTKNGRLVHLNWGSGVSLKKMRPKCLRKKSKKVDLSWHGWWGEPQSQL